jgi:cobalamin biosynthesis protein CobT
VFKIDQNSYGANLMILVDESGSMTTKKLPIAREAIISLMEALDGTKINTCVIGFAAKNHSLIISEKIYKEFNSPIDRKKLASINTTAGYEYNRDGDSFELAAKHFAETNHINSLMIIISDGCPNHGSSYTSAEGRRLTNLSIRLLRNRGIDVHALGIKIYTPITYSEMYDKKGITFIDTMELEMALITLIRQIASDLVKNSFNY